MSINFCPNSSLNKNVAKTICKPHVEREPLDILIVFSKALHFLSCNSAYARGSIFYINVHLPKITHTVPPESICTSAAGFTRWTQGQCTCFALASTSRGTNEARDETETKPRQSRVLHWPRLCALNCLCLLFVCVSLLVIRSHLPKRFSRKPRPPLAISSMHRSRLKLLSLEIKAYVNTKDFEVKIRQFSRITYYRSVNLLSKYPCRTRNFSNKLIENGE